MPDSTITTTRQHLRLTDVTSIVITDTVQTSDGRYVRAIRVFGTPTGTNVPPLFELTVDAATSAALAIPIPPRTWS